MSKLNKKISVILISLLMVSCASQSSRTNSGYGLTSTGMCNSNYVQESDNEAVPCLIKNPRYPRTAALNRIMGHVVFNFTINESGRPADIKMVESVPEGVFDGVAIDALSQWLFKPKTVDGVAVSQENMTYTMEFNVK